MRGSLRKIDGVREAQVSLKEGMATIAFGPANNVRVTRVWKAVRDNGFSPRESTIRARGGLVTQGDTTMLVVGGSAERFVLRDGDTSARHVAALRALPPGTQVELSGELSRESATGKTDVIVLRIRALHTP